MAVISSSGAKAVVNMPWKYSSTGMRRLSVTIVAPSASTAAG